MNPQRRPRAATRPRLEVLEGRQLLASVTFTVTNVNDAGPGSLRQAITDADAVSAQSPSRVIFAILPLKVPPGAGGGGLPVETITVASQLPAIGSGVVLDGTTQPGYAAASGPVVLISGLQQVAAERVIQQPTGLLVSGDYAGVVGLAVSGFSNSEITLTGQRDVIQGDRLGLANLGNPQSQNTGLALLGSSYDTIGGIPGLHNNVIQAQNAGIYLGPGSSHNLIESNVVTQANYGLYSVDAANNTIGSNYGHNYGNQFINDGISGVILIDDRPPALAQPAGNLIAGNVIVGSGVLGLNGNASYAGPYAAVELISTGGNTIGGVGPSPENHIIDNYGDGVYIGTDAYYAPKQATASGNVVTSNVIGGIVGVTDVYNTLQTPLIGNRGNAITLGAGASGTLVGGNTLSYNGRSAISDAGQKTVATGNTETHDDQRQVDLALSVKVVPSSPSLTVGSFLQLDITVVNNGPGYAGLPYLDLTYGGGAGLQYIPTGENPQNEEIFGLATPIPNGVTYNQTGLMINFDHSNLGRFTSFAPGERATIQLNFVVTKAGTSTIQAGLTSEESLDTNSTDKNFVATVTGR